jgi:hypothetical protein
MGRKRRIPRASLVPVDVCERLSFVDTIAITLPSLMDKGSFRALRAALINELRPQQGRIVLKRFVRRTGSWFLMMFVHQPTLRALEVLANAGTPFRVTQVHLALDLVTHTRADAETLMRHVEARLCPGRKQAERATVYGGKTTYFAKGRDRGTETILYWDLPSKAAPQYPCLHLEVRLKGARALRSVQLENLKDIADINHNAFWDSVLVLRRAPGTARLVEARQRRMRAPADGAGEGRAESRRCVGAALRTCENQVGEVVASDLLRLLAQQPAVYGSPATRLLDKEAHTWMLPGRKNALWESPASPPA